MKERKLWRSPIGSSVETQYVQIEPQRVNMISHERNIGAYLREPFTHSLISSLSIVVEFLTMIIILINIIGRFLGRNKKKQKSIMMLIMIK